MHATYQHSEGWFPIIGITFERFFEMVLSAAIVVLEVVILVYLLAACRKCLSAIIKPTGALLVGLALHTLILTTETILFVYHTVEHIPLSWYPATALTAIPMAIDIPRQGVVWFLLAYCTVNGWITVYGLGKSTQKTEGKPTTKKIENIAQPQASEIRPGLVAAQAHMFTGMRIDIQH